MHRWRSTESCHSGQEPNSAPASSSCSSRRATSAAKALYSSAGAKGKQTLGVGFVDDCLGFDDR